MLDELTLAGYFSSLESTSLFQTLAKNQISPGRKILPMGRESRVIFEVCIKIHNKRNIWIKGLYRIKGINKITIICTYSFQFRTLWKSAKTPLKVIRELTKSYLKELTST